MSSGAGAGKRCRVGVDGGVVDLDDRHLAPVQPRSQPGGGDRGRRRGIGEHELHPRRQCGSIAR